MNKFIRNLLSEWRRLKLPFEGNSIIVGVSGGADSVSLALALNELKERKKLNLDLIIAHFNHNLRGQESKNDAKFVKDLAKNLEFKFESKTQDSKSKIQDQKGNLEQNARNKRYEFLKQIAKKTKSYAVLTAHTKNDQAETLLFNLIRGSGLDGLAGMKILQKLPADDIEKNKILLVRPLLGWAKRQDTENYCLENGIKFRHDLMNDDLKFSRVRIRKEIIPNLEKINPKIIEVLSQTADILREEAQELKIEEHEVPEILLKDDFIKLSKSKRRRVLRVWLETQRGDLRRLGLKHFEAIEHLILSRKTGRIIELPTAEKVVKKGGKVFFEK